MGIGSSKEAADQADRILVAGKPAFNRCDNKITTYKYTLWSFIPVVSKRQCLYIAAMFDLPLCEDRGKLYIDLSSTFDEPQMVNTCSVNLMSILHYAFLR